jgi:hypothetical protein
MEPNGGVQGKRDDSFTSRFLTSKLTTRQINQLAIVFAALTVLSCLCSVVTFFSPHVFFNFLEPTRVAPHVLPTTTPSPLRYPTLPPEWTLTPARTLTPVPATGSHTPTPSDTPSPSATGPRATPTRTPTPTRTATKTRVPTATRKPTATRAPSQTPRK